ncbi:cadherin, partial [Aureococcus anophagefferens]
MKPVKAGDDAVATTMNLAKRFPSLTVFGLALALHSNCVGNGVVWDDRAAVTYNKDVDASNAPYGNLWIHDYWGQPMSAVDSHKSWRPLATLTFRWNHAVHGFRPFGFHAANVVVHALSCVFFLGVARQALRDELGALLAAVAFVAHPIHSEAVASIVGRADVLGGCLCLGAVRAYGARWGKFGFFYVVVAFALGVLAALAKEVLEFVDALCGRPGLSPAPDLRRCGQRLRDVGVLARLGASVFAVLGLLWLHALRHGEALLYEWSVLENSVAANLRGDLKATLLSYLYLHGRYALKLVAPLWLCYDYGFPCVGHVEAFGDARNLLAAGLYAGLAALAVLGVRRRSRAILLAGALGYVPFLPAGHLLLPVGTMLGERLLYLPSAGFCLAFAAAARAVLVDGAKRGPGDAAAGWRSLAEAVVPGRRAVAAAQRAALAAAAVLLGACARSSSRNLAWRSERALFEASLDVCPSSLKVLNNLALVLLNSDDDESRRLQDLPRAAVLLDGALGAHRDFPSALFNRGLVHHLEGRKMSAIQDFSDGLGKERGEDPRVETYLGQEFWLLMRTLDKTSGPGLDDLRGGLLQLAAQHLEKGDARLPLTHWARASAAAPKSVAFEVGDHAAVETNALLALDLSRQVTDAGEPHKSVKEGATYNILGLSRRALGDDGGAFEAFEAGLVAEPESFELLSNAASLLADHGDHGRARDFFDRAVALEPESAEVMNNFGFFLERKGDLEDALAYYLRAQELLLPASHPQIDTNVRNIRARIANGGKLVEEPLAPAAQHWAPDVA